ncbi:tail completion protein gp17 [Sphingobium yanoikuyae]|uniref:tail completion protein gp17 n=1 Tax=Sphingobium yanoikuyae TaxID=13690 RepID=UPI0028A5C6FE|nr:DUF3168 domain-containing protein [Sphingobium yanoikuyae]
MASDLLRETERAAVISLKGNAPLISLVPKLSIDPQPLTAGFDEDGDVVWPFLRIDGTQAIPQGRGCNARSEISFAVHAFAKPRYDGGGAMLETARDFAGRINSAVVEAMQAHAYIVAGRRYRFSVRSSRLMRDGDEADAWHGIVNVLARAYQG